MYAIASRLIGFRSSTLRVKILRDLGASGFHVVTADLLDAGTQLVLDRDKIVPEKDTETVACHRGGLVTMGWA